MTKPTAYEAARDTLAALEHEQTTIDGTLKQAGMTGDGGTYATVMARKHALPTLIDRARRELAPLEMAYYDDQLAQLEIEAAPMAERLEAAWAAVEQARAAHRAVQGEMGTYNVRRQELAGARKRAWRAQQFYEANNETPPPAEQGTVVRSLWQQNAVVKG